MEMKNYKPVTVYPLVESDDWMNQTGALPVKLTNDYLFRALLQSDNETLKALLASLLHMQKDEIVSAVVTNPILLGEALGDKTFILDVSVEMNDGTLIDLEMQVVKETGWTDRSVSYICRSFDQLNQGAVYTDIKPVRQITFCDFTVFKERPEFYSTYKLINVKNIDQIYTEKFIISNVDLTRLDLATEEDREYGIDVWAKLFKATTWEEMKMLAENNVVMGRAVSGVRQLTEEEMIRKQCRAREEWLVNDRWKTEQLAKKDEQLAEQSEQLKKQSEQLAEKTDQLAEQSEQLAQKDEQLEKQSDQLTQKDAQLAEKDEIIARLMRENEQLRKK